MGSPKALCHRGLKSIKQSDLAPCLPPWTPLFELREVSHEVLHELLPKLQEPQRSVVEGRPTRPFQFLRRKEAAQMLGISERELFSLTQEGTIDHGQIVE
jgi:hypothetical protein